MDGARPEACALAGRVNVPTARETASLLRVLVAALHARAVLELIQRGVGGVVRNADPRQAPVAVGHEVEAGQCPSPHLGEPQRAPPQMQQAPHVSANTPPRSRDPDQNGVVHAVQQPAQSGIRRRGAEHAGLMSEQTSASDSFVAPRTRATTSCTRTVPRPRKLTARPCGSACSSAPVRPVRSAPLRSSTGPACPTNPLPVAATDSPRSHPVWCLTRKVPLVSAVMRTRHSRRRRPGGTFPCRGIRPGYTAEYSGLTLPGS